MDQKGKEEEEEGSKKKIEQRTISTIEEDDEDESWTWSSYRKCIREEEEKRSAATSQKLEDFKKLVAETRASRSSLQEEKEKEKEQTMSLEQEVMLKWRIREQLFLKEMKRRLEEEEDEAIKRLGTAGTSQVKKLQGKIAEVDEEALIKQAAALLSSMYLGEGSSSTNSPKKNPITSSSDKVEVEQQQSIDSPKKKAKESLGAGGSSTNSPKKKQTESKEAEEVEQQSIESPKANSSKERSTPGGEGSNCKRKL